MSSTRIEFGDRVRHAKRPEWGIGSVVKAEVVTVNGEGTQRISVRFPGVGIKTLNTAHAELHSVPGADEDAALGEETHPVRQWEKLAESEWLAPVAQKKIEEAMTTLSAEVQDPFSPLAKRLAAVLALYRFDRSGGALVDWAVAQTGLEDPLSRFNRHELEQFFDRWAHERELQLSRLLEEAREDRGLIDELLEKAPEGAGAAVRRLL